MNKGDLRGVNVLISVYSPKSGIKNGLRCDIAVGNAIFSQIRFFWVDFFILIPMASFEGRSCINGAIPYGKVETDKLSVNIRYALFHNLTPGFRKKR